MKFIVLTFRFLKFPFEFITELFEIIEVIVIYFGFFLGNDFCEEELKEYHRVLLTLNEIEEEEKSTKDIISHIKTLPVFRFLPNSAVYEEILNKKLSDFQLCRKLICGKNI